MSIKLKKSEIKNFGALKEFSAEWDGRHTRLIGMNGKGKTTIGLTSILAAINGIAERNTAGQLIGQRFRFIAKDSKNADIQLTFYDETLQTEFTIQRHFTQSGSSLKFHTDRPDIFNKDWLSDFLSVSFLSASHFMKLTPKQQALELGIDTTEFDEKLQEYKQEYTFLNREYSNIIVGDPVEETQSVDITELNNKRQLIFDDHYKKVESIGVQNEQIAIANDTMQQHQAIVIKTKNEIQRLKAELEKKEQELSISTQFREKNDLQLEIPIPAIASTSIEEIDEKLKHIQDINTKAILYNEYIVKSKQKTDKKAELTANKVKQDSISDERLQWIQQHNLYFDGLSIDKEGGLLLNDRPIQQPYFSHAESEIIVAKLHAALIESQKNKKAFKFRFIDNLDLLDAENQKNLLEYLFKMGFQVVTAEVGTYDGDATNVICLSEKVEKKEKKPVLI